MHLFHATQTYVQNRPYKTVPRYLYLLPYVAPSFMADILPTTSLSNTALKGSYQIPFVEKYRPRTLDDVVGNEETILRLRAIANDGNMPNLILCGPPGTGKTTSIHALARQLLGSSYKNAVLELNASDARGIDVRSVVVFISIK
jgi:ATP-dependent Clp protease ATP-binding subunit ClpA